VAAAVAAAEVVVAEDVAAEVVVAEAAAVPVAAVAGPAACRGATAASVRVGALFHSRIDRREFDWPGSVIDPANSCFCHNAMSLSGLAAGTRLCLQLTRANEQTGVRSPENRDGPLRDPQMQQVKCACSHDENSSQDKPAAAR
jgi:hypothetical protein